MIGKNDLTKDEVIELVNDYHEYMSYLKEMNNGYTQMVLNMARAGIDKEKIKMVTEVQGEALAMLQGKIENIHARLFDKGESDE